MDNKNLVLLDYVVYGQQNYEETKTEMPEDLQKALPDIDELRKLLYE